LPTAAIVGIVLGGVTLLLVVVVVVVALFVFGNGVVRLKVPGAAMEPTIRAGQTVTARKVDPGGYQPKRGDIVVFAAPARWTADDNAHLIKRVIGLPGERLTCCDPQGRWMIGGKPLDEPYVKAGSTSGGMSFDAQSGPKPENDGERGHRHGGDRASPLQEPLRTVRPSRPAPRSLSHLRMRS
jgi:signal peptidase I